MLEPKGGQTVTFGKGRSSIGWVFTEVTTAVHWRVIEVRVGLADQKGCPKKSKAHNTTPCKLDYWSLYHERNFYKCQPHRIILKLFWYAAFQTQCRQHFCILIRRPIFCCPNTANNLLQIWSKKGPKKRVQTKRIKKTSNKKNSPYELKGHPVTLAVEI